MEPFFAFLQFGELVICFICSVVPLAAIVALVIYLIKKKEARSAELPAELPATASDGEIVGNSPNREEELYADAAAELEGGDRDKGLWAKCFAECDGDENKAKARYIQAKVSQLRDK